MKKLYEKWDLNYGMTAKISPTSITLKSNRERFDFVFPGSKPDTVKRVAELMLKAVEIAGKQKPKEFAEKDKIPF